MLLCIQYHYRLFFVNKTRADSPFFLLTRSVLPDVKVLLYVPLRMALHQLRYINCHKSYIFFFHNLISSLHICNRSSVPQVGTLGVFPTLLYLISGKIPEFFYIKLEILLYHFVSYLG